MEKEREKIFCSKLFVINDLTTESEKWASIENELYTLCLRNAKLEESKRTNPKKINSQGKREGNFLFVISWFALEYFLFRAIYFSLASACEKGDFSN